MGTLVTANGITIKNVDTTREDIVTIHTVIAPVLTVINITATGDAEFISVIAGDTDTKMCYRTKPWNL